ncbi:GNAT family N-acetyltransferase [Ornithinimicrobium faecis]|uniref:GNAT family N-acetyltransferase n=1 Tax=Ornithinimicrobium faecis TaxID=2934158 RepID=UPI0021175BBF|nr:GNAT family N-acetyltransferase [Ornithinimicrobium sp. HY1745]
MSTKSSIRPVMDPTELHEVYAALLAPSFPPSELVPTDWLIDGVASGAVSVLVTEDESGPVAIAVTEPLEPSPAVLLTYFATRADRRGQGVGSQLFDAMVTAVQERTHAPLLVAEVERPDRHAGSPEFGDPSARLRFYGRHGARALDLPYFQPPIGDGDPVHGILLLALHVDAGLVTTGPGGATGLPGPGLVSEAIDSILGDPPPAGDGPAAAALRAAAATPTVQVISLEDYQQVPASEPDPTDAAD